MADSDSSSIYEPLMKALGEWHDMDEITVPETDFDFSQTTNLLPSQIEALQSTEAQGSTDAAKSPLLADTSNSLDWIWRDGDDNKRKPMPASLRAQIELNCEQMSTAVPSCARGSLYGRLNYRFNESQSRRSQGKHTPWVVSDTMERLLADCYLSSDGHWQIITVNGQNSSFNGGQPAIIIASDFANVGGVKKWFIWDPHKNSKEDYDEKSSYVLKLTAFYKVKPLGKDTRTLVSAASKRRVSKRVRSSHDVEIGGSNTHNSDQPMAKRSTVNRRLPLVHSTLSLDSQIVTTVQQAVHQEIENILGCSTAGPILIPAAWAAQHSVPVPGPQHSSTMKQLPTPLPSFNTGHSNSNIDNLIRKVSGTQHVAARMLHPPLENPPTIVSSFVFQKSLFDSNPTRIPIQNIRDNQKLFEYALCANVASEDTSVLRIIYEGQVFRVMRSDEFFFNEFLKMMYDEAVTADAVVSTIGW